MFKFNHYEALKISQNMIGNKEDRGVKQILKET